MTCSYVNQQPASLQLFKSLLQFKSCLCTLVFMCPWATAQVQQSSTGDQEEALFLQEIWPTHTHLLSLSTHFPSEFSPNPEEQVGTSAQSVFSRMKGKQLSIPLTLFFFLKVAEAIWGLLWLHINFWSFHSRSVDMPLVFSFLFFVISSREEGGTGILIGIALNL